jgi:prepilin-type N-terminal cleavage/methylation domain-containing protein
MSIKKFLLNKNQSRKAFTLLEFSIVISIIAVLMTGAMTIGIGSININKKNSSQQKIEEIYRAIGRFLLVNRRLPCPANIDLTRSSATYGDEVGTGSGCSGAKSSSLFANIFFGMVPVKTLGLPLEMAEDDFGAKFSYFIDQRFTKTFSTPPNFTNQGFGAVSAYGSVMTINEKNSSTTRAITSDAILVILSYGLNKSGAYNANSSVQNTRSSDADEMENDYISNFNNIFVFSSKNSDVFDDILFYKTRNQIAQDFEAFDLIACENAGAEFAGKNLYYGQSAYATLACTGLNYTKFAEKYCDKFGNWVEVNRCAGW